MGEIHKLTKEGVTLFPATTTDAVVHPQVRSALSNLINDYNVTDLFPKLGVNGGDKYNLQSAISVLEAKLLADQKKPGIKVLFVTTEGEAQEWRYNGDLFTEVSNWTRNDKWYTYTNEDVEELIDGNILNDTLRKSEQSLTTAEKKQVKANLDLNISAKSVTWTASSNLNTYQSSGIYTINGYRVNSNDNMPSIGVGADVSISAILMVLGGAGFLTGQNITITEAGTGNTRSFSRTYNLDTDTWTRWIEDRQIEYVGTIDSLDLDLLVRPGMYNGTLTGFSKLNTDLPNSNAYSGTVPFNLTTIGNSTRCTQILYPLSSSGSNTTILIRVGNGSVFNPFTQVITKTTLDNILAETINLRLENIVNSIEDLQATVKDLQDTVDLMKLKESSDYCVAAWDPNSLVATCIETYGNLEFCDLWEPYLFDTSKDTGEELEPVGKLKRNNLFRFEDGTWAPAVCIKEERRAECDVDLYTKNGNTLTLLYSAGTFNATEHYENYGVDTKLYNSAGNEVNVLRPWETTETKYTIGIGRKDTVYLLDNVIGNSGKAWKGIFAKPVTWDGIDVTKYELKPTAIAPSPSAVIKENGVDKMRNFFYLFKGESCCGGTIGTSNCTMFVGDRTWPVTCDANNSSGYRASQISIMKWARNNNVNSQSPMPIAEGGLHAWNTYITSYEVMYGTKFLHATSKFTTGIAPLSISNETSWKTNGGIRFKTNGGDWKYRNYGEYIKKDGFYLNTTTTTDTYWSLIINNNSVKEECMESQIVASYAAELGIEENTEFNFYGNTYWYINVPNCKGLKDGKLNVLIYKKTTPGTITLYSTTDRSPITLEIEIILKMPLINGVKLIGDCIVYRGGGNEFIGTIDHITDEESNAGNFPIKIYQEFDQSNWDYNTDVFKNDLGTFSFETKYKQLGDTVYNLQGQGFCKRRIPYTNFNIEQGGSNGTGECCYIWSGQWGIKVLNRRIRLGLRTGFTAASGSYGFRSGMYNTTLDLTNSTVSGNMQIRMKV